MACSEQSAEAHRDARERSCERRGHVLIQLFPTTSFGCQAPPFHREDGLCFILSFSSRLGAKTEGGGPGEAKPRAPGKLKALSATGVGRRCSREAEALNVCGRVRELWLLLQLRQGGTRSPAPTVPLQRDARGILLSSRARRAAINDWERSEREPRDAAIVRSTGVAVRERRLQDLAAISKLS